tara:strand:- start:7013 stop:9148 length:2136 start_codon:yes stop_codon:yes gene_type:complete
MKKLFQFFDSGETKLIDLPSPIPKRGEVLIATKCSLVSSGTEKTLIDFGKANLIEKAKQQPDKLAEAISKFKTDGLMNTVEAIRSKLDQPIPLGYCNAGVVKAIGDEVKNFKVGDRVASNGPHAELVTVPENLCAHIPDNVSFEEASFTIVSSIGLQGVRLLNPTIGETYVVSGLGLIGLITCQILLANGCIVLGLDPNKKRCDLAESLGVKSLCLSDGVDPVQWCVNETKGIGVDGFLITASTASNDPIVVAAKSCRKRGRIILIGVTGLQLRRDLFYEKELTFQVSCSYGPGRYDKQYEEDNIDYPIGFVRWTEQRNFQSILKLIETKSLNVKKLISHQFVFDNSLDAYELLLSREESLGIVLNYSELVDINNKKVNLKNDICLTNYSGEPIIGFIGSGNYASRTLIPAFAKAGANLHMICSPSASNTVHIGTKFSFNHAISDIDELLLNSECNTIVVASRHDSHADLVIKSLKAGKNVFVEKPLCLTKEQLNSIKETYFSLTIGPNKTINYSPLLMVGFNRRFSPLLIEMKNQILKLNGPLSFVYTCNAGYLSKSHWLNDPHVGGGRFIGEACHFVDLLRFLSDQEINDIKVFDLKEGNFPSETFSIHLSFKDGSIGTIHYLAKGNKSFPKERIEVFASGSVIQLDNFRKLKAWGISSFRSKSHFKQDKGQFNCALAFLDSIRKGESSPIPIDEIFEVQHYLLNSSNN